MQTCPPDELLEAYLEEQAEADHGVCSLAKWADFAAHLETCESCCHKLDLLTGKGTADKALAPSEGDFLKRLAASPGEMLARQQAPPHPALSPWGRGQGEGQIGGYEILAELGRGGMGVVYKARDTRLKRPVALKMILADEYAGEAERTRFRLEAAAAARLQHPGIVPIYEIGEQQGLPYLALEFVEGGTLKDRLKGTPLPPRHAARMTALLAQAMHTAHENGILHRDLKPANVFLMPAKETEGIPLADGMGNKGHYLPKIGDFGLAKILDEEHGQTQSGAVMGTPSYMAPEQAEGKSRQMSPAVDVYALGAILYDLLTGRPPFKGESTLATLEQVRTHDPVPPCQLQSKVPRDLEIICLKCLRKEPHRRYASAEQLADDLKRWLAGEPIRARPVGRLERTWRWCRRKPAIAGLVAALTLALVVGVAGVAWQWRRAEERRKQAESMVVQLRFEDAIRQPGENRAWSMFTAAGLLRDAIALENRPLQDSLRLHLGSWFQEVHPLKYMLSHENEVDAVAFSPDGKLVLTGSRDKTARLWEASTGNPIGPPLQHEETVWVVAFSPDGKIIATGCWDHTARLWQAATGQPLGPAMRHQAKVERVSFSPDGKTLLTRCQDNTAWLWEAATGRPLGSPQHHPGRLLAAAVSPDGKTVLTGSSDRTTRLWRVPAPIEGDPERILLWAQVITGLELDEYGGTRGRNAATWEQRRQRLQELGGPP